MRKRRNYRKRMYNSDRVGVVGKIGDSDKRRGVEVKRHVCRKE